MKSVWLSPSHVLSRSTMESPQKCSRLCLGKNYRPKLTGLLTKQAFGIWKVHVPPWKYGLSKVVSPPPLPSITDVVGRTMLPQRHPNPQSLWIYDLPWQKGLCRCNYMKDPERQRWSSMIQVGPMSSQHFYKREADGHSQRGCDNSGGQTKETGGREAMIPGRWAVCEANSKEVACPFEPPERTQPYRRLDVSSLKPLTSRTIGE